MKTTVYIDGYNLYFGLVKNTPFKWLNLISLFSEVVSIKFRADAYSKAQKYLKALEDYNRFIGIDPDSTKIVIDDIAYIHLKAGNYRKAIDASVDAKFLGIELDEGFYSELEGLKVNN